MKDWVKVYSGSELFKAKLIEALLFENGITAQIINKQDSMYLVFGEIQVFVHSLQAEAAIELIQELDEQ